MIRKMKYSTDRLTHEPLNSTLQKTHEQLQSGHGEPELQLAYPGGQEGSHALLPPHA